MLFFGLFTLVVLPIFLIIAAGQIKKNPRFAHNPGAGFIRGIFYVFAGMAILADLVLIGRLIHLF